MNMAVRLLLSSLPCSTQLVKRRFGREVAGRVTPWLNSHTAATAFRRLSSSTLCGSTCASRLSRQPVCLST
jgi:hypothetical protein